MSEGFLVYSVQTVELTLGKLHKRMARLLQVISWTFQAWSYEQYYNFYVF